MARREMTIDEKLRLVQRAADQHDAQFLFEYDVETSARKYWKLLTEKVGGNLKARAIMRRVMGDDKPGRPSTPLDDTMNMMILPGYIIKFAHELDEKIAKRILASKQRYVRYKSGRFGLVDGLIVRLNFVVEDATAGTFDPIVASAGANDPIVECKPIGKGVYIFHSGPESERKENKRYCVRYKSGKIALVNGEALPRLLDPIVECKPIVKQLAALKKQVQRFRQQMINDRSLPKKYAPKKYYPREAKSASPTT